MNVFICLDDRDGMMFNHRRQSRDREVLARVASIAGGARLLMDAYSAGQFEPAPRGLVVTAAPLDEAGEDDCCFVEGRALRPFEARIGKLFVFRWNRIYPADVRLDIPLAGHGRRLLSSEEFPGHSHDRITMEVYGK